jgi:hypothetical protein
MRTEPVEQHIDRIVADYAVSYCLRAVQRAVRTGEDDSGKDGAVTWTIDDHLMVEFHGDGRGGGNVRVHEIGLLAPLRKELRSKRLHVEYSALP